MNKEDCGRNGIMLTKQHPSPPHFHHVGGGGGVKLNCNTDILIHYHDPVTFLGDYDPVTFLGDHNPVTLVTSRFLVFGLPEQVAYFM